MKRGEQEETEIGKKIIAFIGIQTDMHGLIPDNLEEILNRWDYSKPFPKVCFNQNQTKIPKQILILLCTGVVYSPYRTKSIWLYNYRRTQEKNINIIYTLM